MKVVLITSQQNRRSGTAYTFEQLIFKVYVTSWASSCWPGAFFLWKFKEEALSKFWGSFICHQIKRERERTKWVYIYWSSTRDCPDETAGISEILVMPGMSQRHRNACPVALAFSASSVRAIKRVWVTKRIVFNHLFLKLYKFSSLSFISPRELSFVHVLRSRLLLWSEFLSWQIFLQWLAIVLISS